MVSCASMAFITTVWLGGSTAAPAPRPTLPEVLARSAVYVDEYEQALGNIVSRERYRQKTVNHAAIHGSILLGAPSRRTRTQKRELVSEYLLLRLDGFDERNGRERATKIKSG